MSGEIQIDYRRLNPENLQKSVYTYDGIYWHGICRYEGKLYNFQTEDETDFDAMEAACPCCSKGEDAQPDDFKDCTCTNYEVLTCYLTPLSFWGWVFWKLVGGN